MNTKRIFGFLAILLSACSMQAANGTSTIFWQNSVGKMATWQFISEDFAGKVALESRDEYWTFGGAADFSWDGQADLLWVNEANGAVEISLLQDGNVVAVNDTGAPRSRAEGMKVLGVGDLNQDSSADILWASPNGSMTFWQMDGTTFVQESVFNAGKGVSPAWRLAAIADVTGDGKNDLVWQHADGRVVVSQLDGLKIQRSTLLQNGRQFQNWKLSGVADFDGDNGGDLLWRHADGRLAFSKMNGLEIAKSQLLRNGIPVGQQWRIVGAQ